MIESFLFINTSNLSRIDLELLNQIYMLVQDIFKLFVENMYLEICYSFFFPSWVMFSKGVFKEEALHSLGEHWHFIGTQARTDEPTQEKAFGHLLGTQSQNYLI